MAGWGPLQWLGDQIGKVPVVGPLVTKARTTYVNTDPRTGQVTTDRPGIWDILKAVGAGGAAGFGVGFGGQGLAGLAGAELPGSASAGLLADALGAGGDVALAGARGGLGRLGSIGRGGGAGLESLANLPGAAGAETLAGQAAPAAGRGLMRLGPVARALEGGGVLKGGARILARHPLMAGIGATQAFGLVAGAKAGSGDDTAGIADYLGISAADAQGRLKQRDALVAQGILDAQSATATVFPELVERARSEQQEAQAKQMMAFQAMLNPYVQQVRNAAAQQAEILRDLLPNVQSRYRPVLNAFIGSQEQAFNQDAAANALAMLSQGVGVQGVQNQGGGGGMDANALMALLQQ